jgi:hypothetical protein
VILEVLREVNDRTDGRVTSLTRAEARWVTLVSRARPEVRGWEAYRWAHRYIEWEATGESTEALDLQLARANPILAGLQGGVTAMDRRARAGRVARKKQNAPAEPDHPVDKVYMTEVVEMSKVGRPMTPDEEAALAARLPDMELLDLGNGLRVFGFKIRAPQETEGTER